MPAVLNFDRYPTMLAALVSAGGLTPKVVLFVNDVNPDNGTRLSNLTQPAGDWYTDGGVAATFGEPYWDSAAQRWKLPITSIQYNWAAAGGAGAETIYGYAVVDTAGPEILFVERFPVPKQMATIYDSLIVRPELALPLVS